MPIGYKTIGEIAVESEPLMFVKTAASLLDRGVRSMLVEETSHEDKQITGKCAQDFLRIVYLFLTTMSLPEELRWTDQPMNIRQIPTTTGHAIRRQMEEMRGSQMATPLEVFMFISQFLEPCISASTITTLNVFEPGTECFQKYRRPFQGRLFWCLERCVRAKGRGCGNGERKRNAP